MIGCCLYVFWGKYVLRYYFGALKFDGESAQIFRDVVEQATKKNITGLYLFGSILECFKTLKSCF